MMDSSSLASSLVRPTYFRRLSIGLSLLYGYRVVKYSFAANSDVVAAIAYFAAMSCCVMVALWIREHPERLRALLRNGISTKVRIARVFDLRLGHFLCIVEHDRGRAFVIVRGEPKRGDMLSALVDDGSLAIRDATGRLRIASAIRR